MWPDRRGEDPSARWDVNTSDVEGLGHNGDDEWCCVTGPYRCTVARARAEVHRQQRCRYLPGGKTATGHVFGLKHAAGHGDAALVSAT